MSKEQKNLMPIDYTSRDFETIRDDLLEIAERFYPDSFQDFSEGSFGAMTLDAVAYVGDQLSFYMDYNVNESFMDTAYQFSNVVRHGRALGYKFEGRPSTYGSVALFIMVPASATGIGPDRSYIPIVKRGTTFGGDTRNSYILTANVDFADPRNTTVVARTDPTTGAPTWYVIKAYGNVVSGQFGQESIKVGDYERFLKVTMNATNVVEIISVFDSDGNQYYEVDYLAQDTIFLPIANPTAATDNVTSILKPFLISRKFVTEFTRNQVSLQFGSGKINQSEVVANPQSVAVDVFGKSYVNTSTFDPTRLSQNESFGIVPSNTTLTVVYRSIHSLSSNVAVGSVNSVINSIIEFNDEQDLDVTKTSQVRQQLEVENEEPIVGNVSMPSTNEVKQRIFDTFPTQNRAVTQADYENVAYRMPPKFGAIKRVSVQKDADSQKRNLNMYVISEDSSGKLVKSNSTIKNNLKTWINQYRMINDTIDILDPYILNFSVEFVVRPQRASDKFEVLDRCTEALKKHFSKTYFIGESLYISDVYKALKDVVGVLDVSRVRVYSKSGSRYSDASININENISGDGSMLMVPKNAILEMKYPDADIVGKII
tara:strand:+ start:17200 stop:18996 length:1797 start_codon:yes stop_codon:yes gene_type:complete